jgi:hypothetical protein
MARLYSVLHVFEITEEITPEAYAAFKDDEVWRKASLSSRHDREEILEKADDSQKDLSYFS